MRLYLDSCCIIYLIEGLPQFRDPVLNRLTQLEADSAGVLITSRLSRLECRVKPLRDQREDVLSRYDGFFLRRPLVLAEISASVVERAANLRALHGFKTPDAIHVATAIEAGADSFLTGDASLSRCPDIRVELI
jgi:predicted nucleic acid-binding protein